MRRRAGLVAAMTWLALTGAVITAGGAEARNVGGTIPQDATCVQPGAVVFDGVLGTTVPCICISTPFGVFPYVAGGKECPPGAQRVKIDRNVGG